MIPFRILVRNATTNEVEVVTGEIPPDQWNLLLSFRDEASRLAQCTWIANGMPGSYSVGFDEGRAKVALSDPPPASHTAEVLHNIRPFVLQSEALFYPRVSGDLYLLLPHPELQRLLGENRSMFSGKRMRQVFSIRQNDLQLNSDQAFQMWIDGFEYHRYGTDQRGKEKFLALHGGPPDDLALAVFQDMLRDKVQAILNLAAFVTHLEESPTSQAYLRRSA